MYCVVVLWQVLSSLLQLRCLWAFNICASGEMLTCCGAAVGSLDSKGLQQHTDVCSSSDRQSTVKHVRQGQESVCRGYRCGWSSA